MKKVFCLVFFTSCALYREGFSPALRTVPSQSPYAVESWTTELNIPSQDGRAMLQISQTRAVRIRLNTGVMRYRLGHSVEMQRDQNPPEILQVEPTDNAVVNFTHPKKVLALLEESQQVQVELFVEGSGLQDFVFKLRP